MVLGGQRRGWSELKCSTSQHVMWSCPHMITFTQPNNVIVSRRLLPPPECCPQDAPPLSWGMWAHLHGRKCEGSEELREGRNQGAKGASRKKSHDERYDVSLTKETTNTKHTHKRSEAQWLSDAIHTKLVSKTLINPDCDCGYAIYLTFNNAKGLFATLRFVYCGEELFTTNSKIGRS